jgi:hypothetical protein
MEEKWKKNDGKMTPPFEQVAKNTKNKLLNTRRD